MSTILRITQLALVGVFALTVWGTLVLMVTNGTVDLMRVLRDGKAVPLLPGTTAPLKTVYTGIGPIDSQLTVLNLFFRSTMAGDNPGYAILLYDFCFQFVVQHGLCVLEGSRPGNAGRLISFIALWGASFQNFAVGNTLPIYFLVYLATSPTVNGPSLSTILPSTATLVTLPLSLFLGYLVPALAMSMPVEQLSYDAQQNWLAVWQAFPLWVSIFQFILPVVIKPFVETGNGTEKVNNNVEALRTTYTILKYLSTYGHIASWSVSLKTLERPQLFAAGITDFLHPWTVFFPLGITHQFKVADIGAGANLFLQYDRLGSSAAIVIWAWFMYSQISVRKDQGLAGNAWSILKTAISAACIGPAGAAVALMEARDEAVFAQSGAGRKKVV